MNAAKKQSEGGYALLAAMVLLALGIIVSTGILDSATTNLKTRSLVKTRADQYYEVEATLNKTVSWLQTNSKNIVKAFTEGEFDNNFTLGQPVAGDNEAEFFSVPTLVKIKGTDSSPMLSNNAFFGTASFPQTTNIDTGAAFDPITSFAGADLGKANARVVMMWARETNANFEPIFRIDVVTGNNPDRGVHSYSFVYSTLVSGGAPPGFFGKESVNLQTPNNECASYEYAHAGAVWNRGAQRSNCPIASDGPVSTRAKIYGTVSTNMDGGLTLNPPSGDVSGDVCQAAGCHTYTLPVVQTWEDYCPAHNGDKTINANTTYATGGCWRNITINNNKKLSLTDTTAPYYINEINYGGNNAVLDFGVIPEGEKVRLYVGRLNSNNHINGNKLFNTANAPHQVEIYYLGTETLVLNGTAEMNAHIIAPNAEVQVNGNFNFYGGIKAKILNILGVAHLGYDEALGMSLGISDINFTLKKASQRYR
ncbi:MAG: hypothetical protein PHC51_05960 [bacterium]|nr:hypothetical protein [bacterium]